MLTADDRLWMARAVKLAEKGLYTTSPNPRVGCVLVRDGVVLAEGWHQRAGEDHAEVQALLSAGTQGVELEGSTAYVTLEPCSHTGKTPPCVSALIEAGIRRVVYGMQDPNPVVAGNGLAQLREAGIEVEGPLLENSCRVLNPGFIKRMQQGRPFVRCKMAMSLDGRTAMESGESKWITGPEARRDVQRLRARSCAIITGIGTVLTDDPAMTVREKDWVSADHAFPSRQPLRVVLDPWNRLLGEHYAILQGSVLVVSVEPRIEPFSAALQAQGVRSLCLPSDDGQIDLQALLAHLATAYQCNEVLVEAGATLAGSFLSQGLLDELVLYMAPCLMGSSARPLFLMPFAEMHQKRALQIQDIRAVGDDWRITAIMAD
ncbi:MAG: bifunctional diaminohydroxyphosphoribosylaminopyrimidine deaminase/5-amino-6-(5-phosphoribosylamino)uracil reductase RibD [Pseudomonadales bacterium]|nr:bifunctional diaminohydroxyphosphoribosylaminopyrimidine deaminase/5-amino-6-(5-phosphoribosylamino)uracil reductase RibD [Pseudomonadales bacterium]